MKRIVWIVFVLCFWFVEHSYAQEKEAPKKELKQDAPKKVEKKAVPKAVAPKLSKEQLSFPGIHKVPIIVQGVLLQSAQFYPLNSYRVFRTDPDGTAVPIPFQIDQKDKYQDFILDQGKNQNSKSSNGQLNGHDELCIMGNDVGVKKKPTKWNVAKPDTLFEMTFMKMDDSAKAKEGAIYIGIYTKTPAPPLARAKYVSFDIEKEQVLTTRYRYLFNKKNYLVVRGVDIEKGDNDKQIILSSSVYMKMDMKYFLTLNLGHSDIESELDAFKVGPVRVIARVNFEYKVLKLKFDLGMYTEVSFFTNAVYLPAVIDNPIDGKKSLNKESYFYYGLALVDNPKDLQPKSNMPDFKSGGTYTKVQDGSNNYWASAQSNDYLLYLEFQPSRQMEKDANIPNLYVENVAVSELEKRKSGPLPLGDSPVNVAVSFGLKNFAKGLHQVQFRVFIENIIEDSTLDDFKTSRQWRVNTLRL